MAKRLTEPQQRLLDEIRDSSTGGLCIRDYGRYSRTAAVLVRRGLVTRRWEWDSWYWYEAVPDQGLVASLVVGRTVLQSYFTLASTPGAP